MKIIMINPTSLSAWKITGENYLRLSKLKIKDLFDADANRFDRFSIRLGDILFDYSKNLIDENSLKSLLDLAKQSGLDNRIEDMFGGSEINFTEKRAVLHTALRNKSKNPVFVDGKDIMPAIIAVQEKMKSFSQNIRNGNWKGFTGDTITDVVNIGIGGSDLGPAMVCSALKHFSSQNINIHFVSNVDGTDLAETIKGLNPNQTLFIIASKTFTTLETLTNAISAKDWFLSNTDADQKDLKHHFVALSTNKSACAEFGIPEENMFEFWDWVGGRYSLWSAIGLSIAIYVGYDNYNRLLEGAYAVDMHFKDTPFERNIPVLMGLLGIWYYNFMGLRTHAIIPYDQYLARFPEFLQQLDMESNGKYIDSSGNQVQYSTGAVVWGTAGTNAQHSFFQLIHQGTQKIPVDFIVPCTSHNNISDHHSKLIANCLAQSEALMTGKGKELVLWELKKAGLSEKEIADILPHKVFNGNIPSNTFLIRKISPANLGALIAIYEHKVFVEGVIWNINSFDQWGVELGKQLAGKILRELSDDNPILTHDSSTNGLIKYFKNCKNA